jgi:hypothetical protein
MKETIKEVAEAQGYELAYSEESHGEHVFGMKIFVKMSQRKLSTEDSLYAAAELIKEKLGIVTAQLDPDGPAQRQRYRAEVENIYNEAGVTAIYMEALPNGYCSRPCCLNKPWFRVTSPIGHIVIGRRKHVWSIDWKDSLIKATGRELFPTEDVTRLDTEVHAWGNEAASRYIRRLHSSWASEMSRK